MTSARSQRAVTAGYGAVLVILPWIGLGTIRLLTGRDVGAGFQPAYLLLAGVILLILVRERLDHLGRELQRLSLFPGFLIACLVVLGVSGLGLVTSPAEAPAMLRFWRFVKQYLQWLIMICFALVPLIWLRNDQRWEMARHCLALGLIFQLVYGFWQVVHFYQPLAWFAHLDGWFTSNPAILSGSRELFLGQSFVGIPRLRGTACEPLYLGNYLLLVIPCLLLPATSRRWIRWLLPAACLLLLLTWARGAYLAGLLALAVGLGLARRSGETIWRRRWLWWLLMVGAVIAVLVAIVCGPGSLLLPWRRLWQSLDVQDWSNLTRFYSMQAAWRAFLLSPVWGVGWGQYAFHFPSLVNPLGLQSQFAWPVVNNYHLQVLCEAGVLGFGVHSAVAIALGRAVWRATDARTPAGKGLQRHGRLRVVLAAAAVVGVWSQLLTFSQYNLPHIWVAVGLLLASLRSGTDQPPPADTAVAPGGRGERSV